PLDLKTAPASKAGPSAGSSCARTAAWMEVPAPRACPQIASVELVPWLVRSRTPTGGPRPPEDSKPGLDIDAFHVKRLSVYPCQRDQLLICERGTTGLGHINS